MGSSPNSNKNNSSSNNNPNNTHSAYNAFSATPDTVGDSNWYVDSGARHHITNNSNNLTTGEKYEGKEHLIVGNREEVKISHVGSSLIHLPSNKPLKIQNVIYSPSIKKNLLSVSALTSQNTVVVEFDSEFFFVKDKHTRRVILQGRPRDGMYQLSIPQSSSHTSTFQRSSVSKPQIYNIEAQSSTLVNWHRTLWTSLL